MTNRIIKGTLFVVLIWVVNTILAFVIFSPANEDTLPIILSWIISNIILFNYFRENNELIEPNRWSLIFMGLLIVLYLIPINNNIPEEALELNRILNEANSDKYLYAKDLFFEIERKWTSPTREYLRQPTNVFFVKDFETLWNTEGYLPSNIQAQMYRKLLLKSERFDERELIFKQSLCINSLHGYIQFAAKENSFADFWSVDQFPEKYRFGQKTFAPCEELKGDVI